MTRFRMEAGMRPRPWRRSALFGFCLILGQSVMPAGCQDGMSHLSAAQRLAVALRLQLNRAATASIRAVMAKTDADSIALAQEAEQTRTP